MGLTGLDIIVILLVGAGALFGWLRGFVCEVLSLLAWFLAIVALRYLFEPVHDLLVRPVGTGASVLAFVLVFALLCLGGKLVYDTIWGRAAIRPEWIAQARTYPLLKSSGATVVDLVEARRGPAPADNQANISNGQ